MAEFDSTAFSAVDSFFVIDKEAKADAKKEVSSNKTRRLGVGAAASPKPKTSFDTTSRLLQVGKKKRKNHGDDDEDIVPDHGDEDEEELGRSGIATEVQEEDKTPTEKKKSKKKKAGKKERQKLKEPSEEDAKTGDNEDEGVPAEEEDENKPIESSTAETKAHNNNEGEEANTEHQSNRKPKRKRRKVRSRQKNIYKDNRPVEERPDHLVPGGYEYKGRPMTTATRSKLQAKNLLGTAKDENATASFRANWDTTDQELEDNGVPVLSVAKELPRKDTPINNARNGKSKKKKSKYKNIK